MAIPETELARIRTWADERVPAHVRDKVWIEADVVGHTVTIFQCHPPWDGDGPDPGRSPVARLRYVAVRTEWELFCVDGNLRYVRYGPKPTARQVATLLREIDDDPTCIFWG